MRSIVMIKEGTYRPQSHSDDRKQSTTRVVCNGTSLRHDSARLVLSRASRVGISGSNNDFRFKRSQKQTVRSKQMKTIACSRARSRNVNANGIQQQRDVAISDVINGQTLDQRVASRPQFFFHISSSRSLITCGPHDVSSIM